MSAIAPLSILSETFMGDPDFGKPPDFTSPLKTPASL
jgi:hypothetical protein